MTESIAVAGEPHPWADPGAHDAPPVRDQPKFVKVSGGARPPGRGPVEPARSAPGALTRSSRKRPRPSWRDRSESPTTRRPASSATEAMPSRPGAARTGSATTPAHFCTISEASASRRLASPPGLPSPGAAPISRSGTSVARAIQAASSSAAQSCHDGAEWDDHRPGSGGAGGGHEQRDVARRLLEDRVRLALERLLGGACEQQVHLLLRREAHHVLGRRQRGEGRRAHGEPGRDQLRPALAELGRGRPDLRPVDDGRDDELVGRRVPQRLGQRQERGQTGERVGHDQDRAIRWTRTWVGGRGRQVERRVVPEDRLLEPRSSSVGSSPSCSDSSSRPDL